MKGKIKLHVLLKRNLYFTV